jgi:hypothetical protein
LAACRPPTPPWSPRQPPQVVLACTAHSTTDYTVVTLLRRTA